MLTNQVASYSIFTIQLLVVCLTLVRWPTMKNLTAKRKRLTAKRITSRWGKKKKTRGKNKNLTAKWERLAAKFLRYREDILILISFAVRSWLFFLPWGYSFCGEVFLFAVRLILLPWQLWATDAMWVGWDLATLTKFTSSENQVFAWKI